MAIPECVDGSPAWTINGWSAPKLFLLSKLGPTLEPGRNSTFLHDDGASVEDAGISAGSIITPSYDSNQYTEPILDWDFYHGACPDGGAAVTYLTETFEAVQRGSSKGYRKAQHGVASFFSGLTGGGGLCGRPGGAGIAVEQDDQTLRFRVTHLAPAGPAEADGRMRVGDIIVAVDGRPCVDAAGLDPAQAAEVRRLCAARADGDGDGDGDWLTALCDGENRAIADAEQLRKALAGPPGSWVSLKVLCGAEEVRLRRQQLQGYAGDYM